MQACSCEICYWGSDLPDGKIFCYDGNDVHLPQDCCRNYKEPCRLNPATGQPFDPQEVPGPEIKDAR